MSRIALATLACAASLFLAACGDTTIPAAPMPNRPDQPRFSTADPSPGSAGLWTGMSLAECGRITESNDLDHDGLVDGCERQLAASFAPGLQVQPDCVWDSDVRVAYASYGARPGGDYGYAVQRDPANGARVRVAYLPAYYYDCGTDYTEPHSGDSEFILVDLSFDAATQHWLTERVFLSAHCGTSFGDGYCRWFGYGSFQWVDGKGRGAPVVWVSVRKHANYVSQDECHRSFLIAGGGTDECPSSNYFLRFPVDYVQQNIGSADYPTPWRTGGTPTPDCVGPFFESQRLLQLNPAAYSAPARECWWNTSRARFDGWLGRSFGAEAASYGRHLATYAGFTTGQSVFPVVENDAGVAVAGSGTAPAYATCGYYASVQSGGTAPYTFAWFVDGVDTGVRTQGYSHTNSGSDFELVVMITDATGWTRRAVKQVYVSTDSMHACLSFSDEA